MFQSANRTEKVSDRVIGQIRDAVLSGDLKPGDRLASEHELVSQFEVSKATMREALRVLEAMGLVEIRRGTQGGVFVAEVDMKTTVHSILNFLYFKNISVRHITMLRFMIEPSVAHLAALVRSQEDLDRLNELLYKHEQAAASGDKSVRNPEITFHRYLARMSGNPILILIIDFLDNLLQDLKEELKPGEDFFRQVRDSHRKIVDCMVREDCVGARREMAADLLQVGNYLADATGSHRFDPTLFGLDQSARYRMPEGGDPQGMDPALLQMLAGGNGHDPEKLGKAMMLKSLGSGQLYVLVPDGEPTE